MISDVHANVSFKNVAEESLTEWLIPKQFKSAKTYDNYRDSIFWSLFLFMSFQHTLSLFISHLFLFSCLCSFSAHLSHLRCLSLFSLSSLSVLRCLSLLFSLLSMTMAMCEVCLCVMCLCDMCLGGSCCVGRGGVCVCVSFLSLCSFQNVPVWHTGVLTAHMEAFFFWCAYGERLKHTTTTITTTVPSAFTTQRTHTEHATIQPRQSTTPQQHNTAHAHTCHTSAHATRHTHKHTTQTPPPTRHSSSRLSVHKELTLGARVRGHRRVRWLATCSHLEERWSRYSCANFVATLNEVGLYLRWRWRGDWAKCDGVCWCGVLIYGAVCCRRCVVGCVSVGVDALAVVWCTQKTCHVHDGFVNDKCYRTQTTCKGFIPITVLITSKSYIRYKIKVVADVINSIR